MEPGVERELRNKQTGLAERPLFGCDVVDGEMAARTKEHITRVILRMLDLRASTARE